MPAVRAPLNPALWLVLALALPAGCAGESDPLDGQLFPTRGERATSMAPWLGGPLGDWPAPPAWTLERVSSGVPFPRGLAHVEGRFVALARGRHRRQGGVDPEIIDRAGTLFWVDPAIGQVVEQDGSSYPSSPEVAGNASVLAEPSAPPFQLYDPASGPPLRDTRMDRPYCTLRFDEASRNLFLCGFSGVDLPFARFRKNASDTIHRYDLRTGEWAVVEAHKPDQLGEADLSYTVSNDHYPHHDPDTEPPPHGWLNGGNALCIAGDFLYAAAKDNHRIVTYDLAGIRADPGAGPPASRPVLGSRYTLRHGAGTLDVDLYGPSALVARDGWLYVGFRTSSVVVRVPIGPNGELRAGEPGELLAVLEPWNATTRKAADLVDMEFSPGGELFVVCSRKGRIWNLGVPDGSVVLDGRWGSGAQPALSIPELSSIPGARLGNIAFDAQGRLYMCSGNYNGDGSYGALPGVIYRATPVRQ